MESAVSSDREEKLSPKKLESIRNVDKNLLDLFWNLVDMKQDVRVNASVAIIRILLKKQSEKNGDGCTELTYTVDRLVRGMASTREAARQGYSVLLVEILKHFPQVEVDDVLKLIEKHLPVSNKQEKCPMIIGQLLTYSAIVRSGRLTDSPFLSYVVMNLYRLSLGKSYIQEATHKLLLSLFSALSEDRFREDVWPHLKSELNCGWEKSSADNLWFLLLAVRLFPHAVNLKFLKKHWDNEDILSEDCFLYWKKIIRQSTVVHPQFHPVCFEFLELCVQKNILKDIWIPVVDENLFETDQSEKTYLGFQMVKEALCRSQKKKTVRSILSPKFCSVLTRCYINKKHPLHSAANDLVSFFSDYVKNSTAPQLQIIILKSLLLSSGTTYFSQILKKKEISMIISHLTAESVKEFCELLKWIVFEERGNSDDDDDEEERDKRHQAIVQIGTLMSHPVTIVDLEWRMSVLKFLFLHSFFITTRPIEDISECHSSTETFSPSLRTAFRDSFTKALDSLNRKINSPLPPHQQLLSCLNSLVEFSDNLLISDDTKPLFELNKVQEPWVRIKKLLHKLRRYEKKGGKTNESHAFQILLLQLGLQLFQGSKYIQGILEELEICCKKALHFQKSQEKENSSAEQEDGPPWVQVVIDILISLLSQPSHHMRCVVQSIFPLICPYVTLESLQLIFDVLNPLKEDNESTLIDESDVDDEEMEFQSGTSSEESDEKEENENVDEEFKLKVQKALGSAVNDSDDSEVVLTDSEMFKLDDVLSEAFRSRKKTSHSRITSEQKTLMHFKIRCLDLISSYLKTEPPLNIVLRCVKPIFLVCESSNENRHKEQLVSKAVGVLKSITKLKKFQDYKDVPKSELANLLEYLINKLHKEVKPALRSVLYSLCTFLVLCERKLNAKLDNSCEQELNVDKLECLKKYFAALDLFIKQSSSHMSPQIFIMLMNTCPEYAWLFLEPLEKYAFDDTVRLYRRSQCLGLILSASKFSKGQKFISTEMWAQFSERIVIKVIEALKAAITSTDIKPLYTTELFNLLVTLNAIVKEKSEKIIIEAHPELLFLFNSMSTAQCKNLSQKGKQLRKSLIMKYSGMKSGNQDASKIAVKKKLCTQMKKCKKQAK